MRVSDGARRREALRRIGRGDPPPREIPEVVVYALAICAVLAAAALLLVWLHP